MMPNNIKQYLTDRLLNPTTFGYGNYYGKNWIMIPVRDINTKVLFYKLRKDPFDDTNPDKYKFYPPNSHATLFGQEILGKKHERISIVEGEMDSLLLRGKGIAAITSTAGAGSFKDEWIAMFSHIPNIYIAFDSDDAGMKGSIQLIKKLMTMGYKGNIYHITLPLKDVTDYFLTGKSIDNFFSLAMPVKNLNLRTPPQGIVEDKEQAQAELNDWSLLIEKTKKETVMYDDLNAILVEEWIADAKRYMARLRRIINKDKFNSHDLNEIKKIPIEDVLNSYGIKCEQTFGNRKKFKLREERTPSAVLYVDQNTYYDYGDPSKSGTVIDLVMVIEKCDIKDAIKKLSSAKV
jgi:DNA primase